MPSNGSASTDELEVLLRLAREGESAPLGRLLELYRNYLTLLARVQIGQKLGGKVGASDVVQETFLQAHRAFGHFQGHTEGEFIQWLRRILASRIGKQIRHFCGTGRRDVRRERELDERLDRSSQILDGAFAKPGSSPSAKASRREQAVLLADALARLPDEYREVIELRHLQGLSFPEVSLRMERSVGSVEKLWMRALARLRAEMGGA